jgi:hypothetical protein
MAWIACVFLPPMLAGYLLGQAWNAPELRVARWSWVMTTGLVFVLVVAELMSRRIPPEGSASGVLDRVGAVVFPLVFFLLLANVIIATGTVVYSRNARAASLLGCAMLSSLARQAAA